MNPKKLFNWKNPKLYSILLTVVIIGMLIISGPASAVDLSVSGLPSSVVAGNPATFTVNADFNTNEGVPIEEFQVVVTDTTSGTNYTCRFGSDGSVISCDSGFSSTITPAGTNVNQAYYSNRYGYGYGFLNNVGGYYNQSFGAGYGYGYGSSATYLTTPELKYSLSFTPAAAGTYTFDVYAKSSSTFKYATTSSSTLTVTAASSSSSSSSSSGGAYIPPDEEEKEEEPKEEPAPTVEEQIEDAVNDAVNQLLSSGADAGTIEGTKKKLQEVFEEVKGAIANAESIKVLATKEDAQQQVSEEIEAVREVAERAGEIFDSEDIEFATVTETEEVNEVLYEEMDNAVKEEVKKKLEALGLSGKDLESNAGVQIRKQTKITTITTKDGKTKAIIETVMKVEVGDHVVEIPKEAAATTDFIIGNYEIIEKDPIILFKATDTIKYSIVTDAENTQDVVKESERVSVSRVVEAKNQQPEVTTPEPTDDSDEPVLPEDDGGLGWLPIVLVVLLIAAIVVGYLLTSNVSYYNTKAEKLHKEADKAHAEGNLMSAQSKHKKANKYYKKSLDKRE
jgi:hypothetical protein